MNHTDEDTAPQPTGSFGYCSWHKEYSNDTRLVQIEDAGSTFGARRLSACSACRQIHGLVPIVEQP